MARDGLSDLGDDDFPSFDSLSPAARGALVSAMDVLFDQYLEDLAALSRGDPFSETSMAGVLPEKYNDLYDGGFARRFFVAYVHAVDLIRRGALPRCTADELAVAAVFEYATIALMELGDSGDEAARAIIQELDDYHESIVEDFDYEWLFQSEMDGVEYIEPLGAANLRFSEWFNAFRDTDPVNPLLERKRADGV